MAEARIEVRSLTKVFRVHERPPGFSAAVRSLFRREYKDVRAVDDLSFTIEPSERVGFLGPNGAGKTTTLKMLAGLLHPTSGELRVAGFVPAQRRREFLSSITLVMGQKQQLLWDLPPAETFELNRAIYDLDRAEHARTLDELTHLLDLADVMKKPTRQLSLGERMRCELAAALLHRPKVLFLDEPTIGLDVAMQLKVRQFVREHNERTGSTVILTSHYMEDVLSLCPRVVVIDGGRLVFDGGLRELVERARPDKSIALRLSGPLPEELLANLGTVTSSTSGAATLRVARDRTRDAMAALLARHEVEDVTIEDPPLEEIMRDLFSRGREPAA